MTDLEVNVTGLTRNINAKPNKGGSTVLAHFDCVARGIELRGCAFGRTYHKGLTVWPPKIETADGLRRAVTIADDRLRNAILKAAQDAYRAMGGTDGEWMPHEDPERRERNRIERDARVGIPLKRTVTRINRDDEGEERAGLDNFMKGADGG